MNTSRTPAMILPQSDTRHVYGASCSWNGPVAQVVAHRGLPACPHCKGVLFEQDADDWNRGVAEYAEAKSAPVYPRFIKWMSERGTCSPLRTQQDLDGLRSEFIGLHLI